MNITIRKAKPTDMANVLELIKELAAYERAPQEVENTVEMMLEDGFGDQPVFGCFVATSQDKILGMAIHYLKYSTWKGKKLYLEDLVVTKSARGRGIGRQLFEQCLDYGRTLGCHSMMWQVLDWNEPAIQFYKKYKTSFSREWVDCDLKIN